jgi:hypothetical protein
MLVYILFVQPFVSSDAKAQKVSKSTKLFKEKAPKADKTADPKGKAEKAMSAPVIEDSGTCLTCFIMMLSICSLKSCLYFFCTVFGKTVKMSMPEPDVEVTMFGKAVKMSMPKAEKMSMPEPIVLGDAKAEKMSLPKGKSTKKLSFDAHF